MENQRLSEKSSIGEKSGLIYRGLPWITGAGLAASHTLLSSNCTLPKNGVCTTCGSCVVVVGTLVSWAVWKKGSDRDGIYDKCD